MIRYSALLSACAMLILSGTVFAEKTKIACLGDSITYGAQLKERLHQCYPFFLQQMLGDGCDVRNFGVGGATMLRTGDKPYVKQRAWREALDFRPDVALIMLGTNDTVEQNRKNWSRIADFKKDAKSMIVDLREANPSVRVFLCAPPDMRVDLRSLPAARLADLKERRPRLDQIRVWLREVAAEENVAFVDMRYTTWGPMKVIDGVHPTPFGCEAIARRAHEAISAKWDDRFRLNLPAEVQARPFSFHDFRAYDFVLNGVPCKIACPPLTAKGAPWIWRARFWGHQPQADLAMIERGFHVAYCDVAELFGAPTAVERWNRFYAFMRQLGFDRKPFLEGMSRGGLIIHNWAAANPDKVSGIYGDNPVMDFKSWPAGFGKFHGAKREWEQCLRAYGFKSVAEAKAYKLNPVDHLEPLAKANVPILYVIGLADQIVPVQENAELAAKRYEKLGGRATVIAKPGMNHHPHSLKDPTPIVNFILQATGRFRNPATLPAPSAEFRAGAGWGGDTWWDQFEKINRLVKSHPDLELVFLGDSITQGWTGAADRLARKGGRRLFDKHYGKWKAAALGLSGDRTEHVLFRVLRGNVERLHPKVVVLMIGVNNINAAHHPGEWVAEGTAAIVRALRKKLPETHILMLGCFPTNADPNSWNRRQVDILHEKIRPLAESDPYVTYLDLRSKFLLPDGKLNFDLMRRDGIHLKQAGFEVWAKAMAPTLNALMK